jgi:hypothetical protein
LRIIAIIRVRDLDFGSLWSSEIKYFDFFLRNWEFVHYQSIVHAIKLILKNGEFFLKHMSNISYFAFK